MSNTHVETLNDKWLRLVGIPLSVMGFTMSQMAVFFPGRWDLWWKYAIISLIFTASVWESSRLIIIRMRRRFPELSKTKRRIFWMLFLIVLTMGIWQAFNTWVIESIGLAEEAYFTFSQIWATNYLCSLFVILIVCAAYEAIYFFGQYQSALQKAEHLKNQQVQQQLDALKTRVNPHFLFNSLTTLSALIGEDAPRAERFVDELSKVYRYLLRAGRQPMTTLGEEFQFAESYAFLLKNRFEEGAFSLSMQPDDAKPSLGWDQNIPVLTFQNVLDYFVRTQNLPLHIHAEIKENDLRIVCDHQPKSISFDASDNDWRQLEGNGAKQELQSAQLAVLIPFISNTPTTQ